MAITANEPPRTLDAAQIAQILPHRYPFALLDKITDYTPGQWARGVKCVTLNEPFFQGHFPGQPVMPGVLILEALAQCARWPPSVRKAPAASWRCLAASRTRGSAARSCPATC